VEPSCWRDRAGKNPTGTDTNEQGYSLRGILPYEFRRAGATRRECHVRVWRCSFCSVGGRRLRNARVSDSDRIGLRRHPLLYGFGHTRLDHYGGRNFGPSDPSSAHVGFSSDDDGDECTFDVLIHTETTRKIIHHTS
jgi:hypothetical protein